MTQTAAAAEPAVGVELRPLEVLFHVREGGSYQPDADSFDLDNERVSKDVEIVTCPACKKSVEVEVTVKVVEEYRATLDGRMDGIFEALRKRGIDIDRPMWLHVDSVSGMVTARQEPWAA